MSSALYTLDILRLAADPAAHGRLAAPASTVERRSATCGSRIIVDVVVDEAGRVAAFGQEVRACALGQAAATLLARHVIGRNTEELCTANEMLAAWLRGERDDAGDWPGLDVLAAARNYPARHPSIRLAFEAAAEAVSSAASRAAA